jgi:uncharacterized protein (TIGR02679 family)
MSIPDLTRLQATLGSPALARLREALRRRLELGRELIGRLALRDATPEERQACDDLFARRPTAGRSLMIDLDELATLLREAGVAPDLTVAVEALTGPVANRSVLAAAVEDAWSRVFAEAHDRWPNAGQPLATWLEELASQGILKRLAAGDPARGSELLAEIAVVIAALPARAEPLAGFAARLFGDAHALDAGSARATLAVRAAARLTGVPFQDDAEGRRSAWASVGIYLDELSTPALILNLPASSDSALARLLRTASLAGEPLHLSLRWLLRDPLDHEQALAHRTVFVCENPTIVASAARQLGCRCAPLVCVNGQPATPVKILLRQLVTAGARLRYHGDLDGKGIEIASAIIVGFGAQPWRMGVDDYLAAPKGKALKRAPLATPWCPALAEAMRRERRVVHEESVVNLLLGDLAAGSQQLLAKPTSA